MRGMGRMAMVALLVGCGSGPGGVSEEPYDFSFDDPPGDTAAAATNPGQVKAIDLLRVSGRVDGDAIRMTLEFAEPISPWSAGAANGLDGFIYFDTDQIAETGRKTTDGNAGGNYYLDLRDNGSGRVGLVDVAGRKLTLVRATFDGTRFEVEVKRADVSSTEDADNRLNLAVEIGARDRLPLTDVNPDAGVNVLEPPETP